MKQNNLIHLVMVTMMTIPMFAFGGEDAQKNTQPEVGVSDVQVSMTELTLDYTLTDIMTSNGYSPNTVLIDNDGLIVDSDGRQMEHSISSIISGLPPHSDRYYATRFNVPYDVLEADFYNDKPYHVYEESITVSHLEPTATIHPIHGSSASRITHETIEVHYDVMDENEALIGNAPRIIVLNNITGEVVDVAPVTVGQDQVIVFDNLANDMIYRVKIIAQYDVDGDGEADNFSPYILNEQLFTMKDYDHPQEWDQVYGGSQYDVFESVVETRDGGYIAVGSTSSNTDGEITDNNSGYPACLADVSNFCRDALIVKFDSEGNPVWNKRFGGKGQDYFHSVIETRDGGFVAVGLTDSGVVTGALPESANSNEDGLLVKFDRNGNKKWDHVYGGRASDGFSSIIETRDGDYVVAGFSFSDADGEITDQNNATSHCASSGSSLPCSDALLVKFNSEGVHIWDQLYGGDDYDVFRTVIENNDGGYTAVGFTKSSDTGAISDSNNGYHDGLIVKFNREGKPLWDRVEGGTNSDVFYSVIETRDGGYMAAGSRDDDGWLIKFDEDGHYLWEQSYGNTGWDLFFSLVETSDGDYLATGFTTPSLLDTDDGDIEDNRNGKKDALLALFDDAGKLVWDQVYGGSENDQFTSVIQTSNGDYVAAGYTGSNDGELTDKNSGDIDGLLVKFLER